MSSPNRAVQNALFLAIFAALLVLGQQIAGKVVRDTLFLSAFPARDLSIMMIAAAVFSLPVLLPFTRALAKLGPGRVVTAGFLVSAALYVAEWLWFPHAPRTVAVLVYLHLSASGAALVSGFWSVVNERFDPRTARRNIGRIVAAAALGGALGGAFVGVEGSLPASTLLLAIAAVQVGCAVLVASLAGLSPRRPAEPPREESAFAGSPAGLAAIRASAYLRDLALLALFVTACQQLLEFAFKVRAQEAAASPHELQRLLAIVHTLTSLGIFAVQALFSRRSLEQLGVGGTVVALPVTAMAGAASALAVPNLLATAGAWAAEGIVHSSLFRSGYELLYAPVPAGEKRSAKAFIDVGFARMGDLVAGGLAWLAPFLFATHPLPPVLAAALLFAMLSLWLGLRLRDGHVRTLERSLVERATEADLAIQEDALTRTAVFETMQVMRTRVGASRAASDDSGVLQTRPPAPVRTTPAFPVGPLAPAPLHIAPKEPVAPSPASVGGTSEPDEHGRRAAALRARSPEAREILRSPDPLPPDLVALTIPLLAHEELASDALHALRRVSARSVGQLVDALCDPEQDDTVRRRLPRVLSAEPSERAVDGLLRALDDKRFEVRYQAGLALSRIHAKAPDIPVAEARVFASIVREVEVERSVWEGRQELDRDPVQMTDAVDRAVRERSSRSLEHVFTLLSLVLPRAHLKIAYQGLNVGDVMLRGTALEYLDAVLPVGLREKIWPYLSDEAPRRGPPRPKEDILAELTRLNESVIIRIDQIRSEGNKPPS